MKVRHAFLIIVLIIAVSPVSAQWEWQNPLPQGNNLYSLDFINENEGWVGGVDGTIIYTDDGGQTWDYRNSGVSSIIYCLDFIDNQSGLAAGGYPFVSRKIYKTTNGGINWDVVLDTGPNPIYDLFRINEDTCIAVGAYGELLISFDGGNNWQNQYTGFDNHFRSCWFFTSDIGWIVGEDGTVLRKTGENSWLSIDTLTDADLYSIYFIDDYNGWICGSSGNVFRTQNGGETWLSESSLTNSFLAVIDFIGPDTGWIIGGQTLHTTDGGESWELQQVTGLAACFLSASVGYTTYSGGRLYKTNDGGDEWIEISRGFHNTIEDICFLNPFQGWVFENASENNYVYRTDDGGLNWNRIDTTDYFFDAICFIDENQGWAAGFNEILHTSNGGFDWELQLYLPGDPYYQDIIFVDQYHGWALYQSDTIIKTSDGGTTWQKIKLESFGFTQGCFIDQQNGWIVGYTGNILRTTDGGLTWKDVSPGGRAAEFNSVCFVDQFNGWVVGEDNVILHSNDGGKTWESQSEYYPRSLFSVSFIDSLNGWISGSYGEIFHTGNGGLNWEEQETPCWNYLNHIVFVNFNDGWAAGGYGAILHTGNGGMVGAKPPIMVPQERKVSNFPNPFKNSTTIEYTVSCYGMVNIDIYNHLGQHVGTMFKEMQPYGKYQVTWNAENYPPGIYYYTITTPEISTSGKMLVVR